MTSDTDPVHVLVLEHDPANPPLLLGDWLADNGADIHVLRPYDGDEVPGAADGFDALVSLGGAMGVYDEDVAPWLAPTRALLGRAVADGVPTLAIGLGAQLLAASAGGRVGPASGGYRLGAALVAKRDEAELDPLFGEVPITPDVMQFHRDGIAALPPGSKLLLASPDGAIEAFRVGSAAWGTQFHLETTAAALRAWRDDLRRELTEDDLTRSQRGFGAGLEESEEFMAETWRALVGRFVGLVRSGIEQTPWGTVTPRLPIVTDP